MFNFFKESPSISTTELAKALTKNTALIDVRTPVEFRSGHIPGARNIPLANMPTFTGNQKQPIYLICQSGMRSKKATRFLEKQGYHAINVRGGMHQWAGTIKRG